VYRKKYNILIANTKHLIGKLCTVPKGMRLRHEPYAYLLKELLWQLEESKTWKNFVRIPNKELVLHAEMNDQ